MQYESGEQCESCWRAIAIREAAFVWQEKIVCAQCRAKLENGGAGTPQAMLPARAAEGNAPGSPSMAIAIGISAAVLGLLVIATALWVFWISSSIGVGVTKPLRNINKPRTAVPPALCGAMHGRIWWRGANAAVRPGRNKHVSLLRRSVPGKAFQTLLWGSSALLSLANSLPQKARENHRAMTNYDNALAAYDDAVAAVGSARASYHNALVNCYRAKVARRNMGASSVSAVAEYDKAKATYEEAKAEDKKAWTANGNAGAVYLAALAMNERTGASYRKAAEASNLAVAAYDRAEAALANASAAYYGAWNAKDKAFASYRTAKVAYSNAGKFAKRTRAALGKALAAYDGDQIVFHHAQKVYKKTTAAYSGARDAEQLLNAQYPRQIGFYSANRICIQFFSVAHIKIDPYKLFVAQRTKANFRGRYDFPQVAPGRYFLTCKQPNGNLASLHYIRPIQVSAGQDLELDINPSKGRPLKEP